MFVAATVFLLFLVLLYTLVLVFVQSLQVKSEWRVFLLGGQAKATL